MHATLGLVLVLLSPLSAAIGTCKSFRQTSTSVDTEFEESLTSSYRASPGIACGRPELTPQWNYYPQDPDAQQQHQIDMACSTPNSCPLFSEGTTGLSAHANWTANQALALTESDAGRLALRDAPGLRGDNHGVTYVVDIKGEISTAGPKCLQQGESGWLTFRPRYACVAGLFEGCTGDAEILTGKTLTVCVPGTLSNSLPPILAGHVSLKMSTAEKAAARKGNPISQGPDVPGAASGLRAEGLLLLIMAGFAAFVGFAC